MLAELEDEFSSFVVHEVKTPLSIMHGYAMTLLDPRLPAKDRKWFLQVIADQSIRMTRTIEILEELRRVHQAPPNQVAEVGMSLGLAVERTLAAFPRAAIRVSPGAGEGLLVLGTSRWLARAFEEALAGLMVASDGAGEVRIRVRRGPTVSVGIEGPVRPSHRGLGLYLARRVAEAFGGSFSVRGARFTFRLRPANGG